MEDYRYPFLDFLDFFQGLYFLRIEALHLNIAFLFIFLIIIYAISSARKVSHSFVFLYFVLSPFNNPAFQIFNLSFSDIFGILALLSTLLSKPADLIPKSRIFIILYFSICSIIFYSLFLFNYYDLNFNGDSNFLLRLVVLLKPLLLIILGNLFFISYENNLGLIKKLIFYSSLSMIFVYFIQFILYKFFYILTFGSFINSTFQNINVDFMSFGSVSIERGHFGKFSAFFLPIVFYYCTQNYKFMRFLFPAIAFLNFSTSSIFYMTIYSFILLISFGIKRFIFKHSAIFLALLFFSIIYLFLFFIDLVNMTDKLVEFGIYGGNGSGRGLEILMDYLEHFPLGFGYGGSTFRTVDGFPEINSGIFAILSQLSIVGLSFLIIFIIYIYYLYLNAKVYDSFDPSFIFLRTGILLLPIAFIVDPLIFNVAPWFIFFCFISASAHNQSSIRYSS